MDKKAAFLDELTALSLKHGLVISGCGCCGSPDVGDAPDDAEQGFYTFDDDYQGQLIFVSPSDGYHWKKYVDARYTVTPAGRAMLKDGEA